MRYSLPVMVLSLSEASPDGAQIPMKTLASRTPTMSRARRARSWLRRRWTPLKRREPPLLKPAPRHVLT